MRGLAILLLCSIGLAACNNTPRNAALKPVVSIARTVSGTGPVFLNVVDERPNMVVSDVETGGTNIRLEDAKSLVSPFAREALTANGFTIAEPGQFTERVLKIEIRSIELKFAGGFASASHYPRAAMKAIATNKGKSLEKFYRAEIGHKSLLARSDDSFDQMLNEAIGKVISDIANDPELMGFLSR